MEVSLACIDHIIKFIFWRHYSYNLNYMRTYSALPGEWQVLNYTQDLIVSHMVFRLFTMQGTYGRRGEIGAIGLPGEPGTPVGSR